jgi:hypothetical protein
LKISRGPLLLLGASTNSACALVVGIGDHQLEPGAVGDAGLASDAADGNAVDAAVGVGTCGDGGIMLALPFGSADDLKSFVTRARDNPGPSIEPDAGVTLLLVTDQGARDAIWFANPVPLDTFDVTFETLVTCPTPPAYCGDGIAFAWLDATSIDVAFDAGAPGGAAFGIPSKFGGNAVAVDLLKNAAQNDPDTPALEIITLNSSITAGNYPWVVSGKNVPDLGRPMWNRSRSPLATDTPS